MSEVEYTAHDGSTVQSPATVDGEVEYPTDGTAVFESTDDGEEAVTVTFVEADVTTSEPFTNGVGL